MATELLNDLMRRSAGLSLRERKRLAEFLAEEERESVSENTGVQFNVPEIHSHKREQHLAWLIAHREEYGGKYVALEGDQFVGSGQTIREAAAAAKESGCLQPFLVYVPRPEGEYWGGW